MDIEEHLTKSELRSLQFKKKRWHKAALYFGLGVSVFLGLQSIAQLASVWLILRRMGGDVDTINVAMGATTDPEAMYSGHHIILAKYWHTGFWSFVISMGFGLFTWLAKRQNDLSRKLWRLLQAREQGVRKEMGIHPEAVEVKKSLGEDG